MGKAFKVNPRREDYVAALEQILSESGVRTVAVRNLKVSRGEGLIRADVIYRDTFDLYTTRFDDGEFILADVEAVAEQIRDKRIKPKAVRP